VIVLAILFTFLVSFAVAGYQAILPVFVDAGVFSDLCDATNTSSSEPLPRFSRSYSPIQSGNLNNQPTPTHQHTSQHTNTPNKPTQYTNQHTKLRESMC